MKRGFFVLIGIICSGLLTACHKHDWVEATCTEPQICLSCGEVEGNALGHTWEQATCTKPKTCSVCGKTEGQALGHKGTPTCDEDVTCSVCGGIIKATGHTWEEATCINAKKCSVCGKTEGEALGHEVVDGICERCGETVASLVTYDEVATGNYDGQTIQIDGIIGNNNIYDENEGAQGCYIVWYPTQGTYVSSDTQFLTSPYCTEHPEFTLQFLNIKEGDVVRFTYEIYEGAAQYPLGHMGSTKMYGMEIVGNVDINEVYSTAIANAPVMDYESVLRGTSEKYQQATISGTIFQAISQNSVYSSYLVSTNSGYVYVDYKNFGDDTVFLEGDSVTVYGIVSGTKTYSSLIKDNTVPYVSSSIILANN